MSTGPELPIAREGLTDEQQQLAEALKAHLLEHPELTAAAINAQNLDIPTALTEYNKGPGRTKLGRTVRNHVTAAFETEADLAVGRDEEPVEFLKDPLYTILLRARTRQTDPLEQRASADLALRRLRVLYFIGPAAVNTWRRF